jgi:O-antigen ligase
MTAATLTAAPQTRAATGQWVDRLSTLLLTFTMTYAVFGVPGESNVDTSQTDRVSPVNSYVWLVLLILALPIFAQRWRQVKTLLLGCWPLLVLFAYFGLSTIWALDSSASIRRFLFTLVQLILFAILLTGIRRAPTVHVVIAFVCAVSAVADLADWVAAPGTAMTSEGFAGLQGQKNQAGLLMMLGYLSAAPCLLLIRSWLWRGFLVAGILLMLALLVATRSTTSESVVIAATFAMPALVVVSRFPRPVIIAIFGAIIGLIGLVALVYLIRCGATGLDPWLPLRGATFTARTDIWNFVVEEIKKRPFFGAGYSSFWSINPAVQPSLKSDQWFGVDAIINEAHDGYLDMLATNGIVGLAGSLFVLIRTIVQAAIALTQSAPARQAWREGMLAKPTAIFYLALTSGLIIHNFTESNLFSNNALLAVALLIAILDLQKWQIARRAPLHTRRPWTKP